MAELELVIRQGEIVNADNTFRADIGIAGGKIVRIGGELNAPQTIDARGKLLLPGGIDAHVHLTPEADKIEGPHFVDDFTSGSAAALAGGITTVGNMTSFKPGETPLAGLTRVREAAGKEAIADFFLHPILLEANGPVLDEIPQLLGQGHNSIKFFMVVPHFDQQVPGFLEITRRAGTSGLLTLIHCEDHALIEDAVNQLTEIGHTCLRYFPESRPVLSEVVSTQRAVAFAEATHSPVYIVHLSSRRALEVCAEARRRGVPVYVETRPLYLHLLEDRFAGEDGPKYVGQPPLRREEDLEALWAGLRDGLIDTVCTDHAPWLLADKLDPSLSISKLRPGVENLQTMVPMLYSEGVLKGRIDLNRLVEVTSTNAAKLFGLYPRKGTIAVGSDADIVVFDPQWTRPVERSMLYSKAGYSVYEGWPVTGWPRITIRRGEIVYEAEKVTGQPGSGHWLERGHTTAL